jgi:hypothetical protein
MKCKDVKAIAAAEEAKVALLQLTGLVTSGDTTPETVGATVDRVVGKIVEAAALEAGSVLNAKLGAHMSSPHGNR